MEQRDKIYMAALFVSSVMSQVDAQRIRIKYNELVTEFNDLGTKFKYVVHILNREHVELNDYDKIVLYPHIKVQETCDE
jgi:hypothetical protein